MPGMLQNPLAAVLIAAGFAVTGGLWILRNSRGWHALLYRAGDPADMTVDALEPGLVAETGTVNCWPVRVNS